ncbi:G-protein beta WD-40 repeat protein [Reticulomyxa filosa]|uniref:G-protein beta WD-40 repeat protein n=1 Tax=Reticulomyxa filosa TaxID=46433 RepID=X6NBK8_RETFI|nr:G-protein beta WD-40 repeat protein [Reticulomyxa filosa]|eukprot:ETO23283.1 G-protein beta WD-40 repeat protein [Reticulomyxa filosa]
MKEKEAKILDLNKQLKELKSELQALKKKHEEEEEKKKLESERITEEHNSTITRVVHMLEEASDLLRGLKRGVLQRGYEYTQPVLQALQRNTSSRSMSVMLEPDENKALTNKVQFLETKLAKLQHAMSVAAEAKEEDAKLLDNMTQNNNNNNFLFFFFLACLMNFLKKCLDHTGKVLAMSASLTDLFVATSGVDKTIMLWKAAESEADKKIDEMQPCGVAIVSDNVTTLRFSPCGRYLAGGAKNESGKGYVLIWSVSSESFGDIKFHLRGESTRRVGGIISLAFTSNGQLLFAGDAGGVIWCLSVKSGDLLGQVLHGDQKDQKTDNVNGLVCDANGWYVI